MSVSVKCIYFHGTLHLRMCLYFGEAENVLSLLKLLYIYILSFIYINLKTCLAAEKQFFSVKILILFYFCCVSLKFTDEDETPLSRWFHPYRIRWLLSRNDRRQNKWIFNLKKMKYIMGWPIQDKIHIRKKFKGGPLRFFHWRHSNGEVFDCIVLACHWTERDNRWCHAWMITLPTRSFVSRPLTFTGRNYSMQ